MNEQAIHDFLNTTALSWRQSRHPAQETTVHPSARRLARARTCTVVASPRKGEARHIVSDASAASAASGLVAALRPGARLNFDLMRQARVMPRQRDDVSDMVDLRIGDRVVRVRLDTHEVVSVI